MARNILWIAVVFVTVAPVHLHLGGGSTAVCSKVVSRNEARNVPFIETYRESCWLGIKWCYKSRERLRVEYYPKWESEETCCAGYELKAGTCEPFCDPACVNGYCAHPGICKCNAGYRLSDNNSTVCVPVCDKSCLNGKCVSPNTCGCDKDYELKEDGYTCEPVCLSGCKHGWCEKPNFCVCHPGYERNNDNECVPVCEQECINGRCAIPNVCTCNDGFQRSQGNIDVCEPKCSQPCIFGDCAAPETCTCNDGFLLSEDNDYTCEPNCSEPCVFGSCTAPDTCTCEDGYEPSSESKFICIPVCNETCVFGSCIAPDVCSCDDGYSLTSMSRYICNPVCTNECTYGVCVAPDECACNEGFIKDDALNGTCSPICEPECVQGTCSVDGCICSYGWNGIYCEHSEFCVISLLDTINSIQAVGDEFPVLNSTEDANKINSPMALQDVPDCHQKCVDQHDNIAIKYTEVLGNFTHYFVSASSPCNIVAAGWESSEVIIGSVFGIVLFTAIISMSTVYILRRNRKKSYTTYM